MGLIQVEEVKVDYPGLIIETLPSGRKRTRVRVKGDKKKRITLPVNHGHEDFLEMYHAARRGVSIKPDTKPEDLAIINSLSWLRYKYIAHLEKKVGAGLASPKTLKKKKLVLDKLCNDYGEYSTDMPRKVVMRIRDEMMDRPAMADYTVETIRTMYSWANEMELCHNNPAADVRKIDKGKGGAKAWTMENIRQFKKAHPEGTTAHLCLTILIFTACRISDAAILGRKHEKVINGVRVLDWQPQKKGSARVTIPMMPPLCKAVSAIKVVGDTYVMNDYGKPFASGDAMSHKFIKWCKQAGLEGLSAHGIRKGVGNILAESGCSQYQIMAIHGHSNSRTSEVYTADVRRIALAEEGMKAFEKIKW